MVDASEACHPGGASTFPIIRLGPALGNPLACLVDDPPVDGVDRVVETAGAGDPKVLDPASEEETVRGRLVQVHREPPPDAMAVDQVLGPPRHLEETSGDHRVVAFAHDDRSKLRSDEP